MVPAPATVPLKVRSEQVVSSGTVAADAAVAPNGVEITSIKNAVANNIFIREPLVMTHRFLPSPGRYRIHLGGWGRRIKRITTDSHDAVKRGTLPTRSGSSARAKAR